MPSKEVLLVSAYYIHRLENRLLVHKHSILGILVTALQLATKFQDDERFTNKDVASLFSIPILQLNAMEEQLFSLLDHSLYVSDSTFEAWTLYLLAATTTIK